MNKLKDFFKRLLRRFAPIFRDGVDRFLDDAFIKGMVIAREVLKFNNFGSKKAFADALWSALSAEFPTTPGGWVDLLKSYLIEALTKEGLSLNSAGYLSFNKE